MMSKITRRKTLKLVGAGGISLFSNFLLNSMLQKSRMLLRKIPATKETIPVIGIGTWIQFDVGESDSERSPLREVLQKMVEMEGKVIDSSPMYGRAEEVVGALTSEIRLQDKFFYATKVWTSGREAGINQMQSSMKKMRRSTLDLMQIHNLVDWQTHLKTLRDWKEEGKIRYLGITHYTNSSHSQLQKIIESEKIDFVQCNYSIAERHAEKNVLPAAQANGVAVIANRPYEGGNLFSATRNKPLPDWAAEFDIHSWGQFFLKYIVSHPALTCAIPGTSRMQHLIDNMSAGYGRMPDENTRKKMVTLIENL